MDQASVEGTELATIGDIRTRESNTPLPAAEGDSQNSSTDIGNLNDLIGWMNVNFGSRGVTKSLRIAAFLLVNDVLSQDSSKAPMRLMKTMDNGTPVAMGPREHPVAALLADRPNELHTWTDLHRMFGFWLALMDESFVVIKLNSFGDPEQLIPITYGQQQSYVAERKLWYGVTAGTQYQDMLLGSSYDFIPQEEMIHARTRMIDGFKSLSTMDVGRETLEIAGDLDRWRKDIFVEQGAIRGVFKRNKEGALADPAYERLARSLRLMLQRFRNGDPIILEDMLEFQPMAVKPQEAELIEQFQEQVIQVCRLKRVPPHKVFQLGDAKYDNLATLEQSYLSDTLFPFVGAKEDAFGVKLLTKNERRKGLFLQHDRAMLELHDAEVEMKKAEAVMKLGGMTFDEFRGITYKLAPRGGEMGSATMIPTTYQVVGKDGKIIIGGAGTNPNDPNDPNAPAATPAKKDATNASA